MVKEGKNDINATFTVLKIYKNKNVHTAVFLCMGNRGMGCSSSIRVSVIRALNKIQISITDNGSHNPRFQFQLILSSRN